MIATKSHLSKYQAKRNFKVSPEPAGDEKSPPKKGKTLFFCVQKHLASHLHHDFRLEHAGVLLSWAIPKGPSLNPHDKRLAIQVEAHPYDYGTFEGVIPAGYGAGIVMLWDKGYWKPHGNVSEALKKGHLGFRVFGQKLKGEFAFQRFKNEESSQWLLFKKTDEWSSDEDILETKPLSVKSKADLDGILQKNFPDTWRKNPPALTGAFTQYFSDVLKPAQGAKKIAQKSPGKKSKTQKPALAKR